MVGRRRRGDEGGFTLVELVVALTVMAVGIFGLMRVYGGTLGASSAADVRTSATAIATAELEALRSIPFDDLGFEATAPGYAATWNDGGATFDTVTVAAGRAQTAPTGAGQVRKGETFDVVRRIVWLASSDGTARALKRVVVEVTWADRLGSHTVRQDSAVYPGGRGPDGTTTTTAASAGTLAAPTCTSVTQNATTPTTALDLTWTATGPSDPASWEIRRRASSESAAQAVTVTSSLPGATRTFTASGLSAGSSYVFELRGLTGTGSGDSAWGACPAAATQGAAPACSFLSASAVSTNGNIAVRKKSGGLQDGVSVSVNTSGSCGTLRLRFTPSGPSPVVLGLTPTANTYAGSFSKNAYTWSIGNQQLEVLNASSSVVALVSLRVCSDRNCST